MTFRDDGVLVRMLPAITPTGAIRGYLSAQCLYSPYGLSVCVELNPGMLELGTDRSQLILSFLKTSSAAETLVFSTEAG